MADVRRWVVSLAIALSCAPLAAVAQAPKLERALEEQIGVDQEARSSQGRVDQLDDETQRLLSEYRRALADAESYTTYASQLEAQAQSQRDEMAEMDRQLQEVETTSREVLPLMQSMLDTLEQFVGLDVPFLMDERSKRVATLKQMMTRADVAISEKYRRIIEAYQVEMDYGRTIEAYEGQLEAGDGEARTVQFLRVGRVTLLYQTLDGRETGYWDGDQKRWVVGNEYAHGFKEGIAVAKKARAPEMLIVPVPSPQESRS
jgi:septal ring factor EnvC (AmiA/AmiB activator)